MRKILHFIFSNQRFHYVIIQELAKNNEGYTRSQYWYVKDIEPDKFYMGYVWDFNHSYGAVKSDTNEFSFIEFLYFVSGFISKTVLQTFFAMSFLLF